jgi:hypothetical protein
MSRLLLRRSLPLSPGKRGHWYAISKRRAFRTLAPELRRVLGDFETADGWLSG